MEDEMKRSFLHQTIKPILHQSHYFFLIQVAFSKLQYLSYFE